MMAGTGRYDTEMLTIFGKRLFVKGGAEGVICAALPDLGLGIAIKADDGSGRATEPLLSAVLDALLPMEERERTIVAARRVQPINSRTGLRIGEIRPVEGLAAALKA
jgi:L-asparaginase II